MRRPFLLAALLTGPALALAGSADPWADTGIRGQFRRSGDALSCKLTLMERFSPDDYLNVTTDQPCLYFGPTDAAIAIGSFAKPLLASLGPPTVIQSNPTGGRSHFFRFGDGDNPPFFVVTVVDERIAALQVSGPADTTGLDNLSFGGIHLGSTAEQLRKRFGPPLRTLTGSTPESEMWSYLPWPFSFEVAGGKIISVRISNLALR